jgi:hypothetical protein
MVMAVLVASAQVAPGVTVNDQPIVNGVVMVETVVSNDPGWIVIHT